MTAQTGLRLLIAFGIFASAQASKPQPPSIANLRGKVFLITGSGDLKPARFAEVYLLSTRQATEFKKTVIAVQPSLEQLATEADPPAGTAGVIIKYACLQNRLSIVAKTLDDSTKVGETDEEGFFTLKLKPGTYTVVVTGIGGQNIAIWTGDVTVRAGAVSNIKLHEPVIACLNILNR